MSDPALAPRAWVPAACERHVRTLASATAARDPAATAARLHELVGDNRQIHEAEALNLNPAANVMNPAAEALLSAGLGARPSLGWPGDKYEMGLEAVEEIEVIAAELAAETFSASHAEIRAPSGAMANLFGFLATCRPGDRIIAPPAAVAGHVTHHAPGVAGLLGLEIHEAPVDAAGYTVDVEGVREMALRLRPKLITIGQSLNLFPHPVAALRAVADEVGAALLFDAAHLCGLIAGAAWPNPLDEGAHLMTMSTYKSLGGPPGGLIVTREPALAERLDAIAFPGLTANFDAGRVAALALGLLDWRETGRAYAETMVATARALAEALAARNLPVHAADHGATRSHAFALEAARWGGGHAMAKRLRRAGLLTSGIGLPVAPVVGDANGLRVGAPEAVRWGLRPDHAPRLADLFHAALHRAPEAIAPETAVFRQTLDAIGFTRAAR